MGLAGPAEEGAEGNEPAARGGRGGPRRWRGVGSPAPPPRGPRIRSPARRPGSPRRPASRRKRCARRCEGRTRVAARVRRLGSDRTPPSGSGASLGTRRGYGQTNHRLDGVPDFRYILKVRFEWDVQKAAVNRTKHGISFEEAITAFDDPFALVAPDLRHSATEEERLADRGGGPRHLGRRLHDPAARQHVPTHQRTPRESQGAKAL